MQPKAWKSHHGPYLRAHFREMSLRECHLYTINGNATNATEVMVRNSKEAAGYDFRKILQSTFDPISAPGEPTTRSNLLIGMVQASQQLAALNYGNCRVPEYNSGFDTSSKIYAAYHGSTSPEEADSVIRPLVDELDYRLICSRSSSQGILRPLLDRDLETRTMVTASKGADDDRILHSPQDGDEAALTGLVMEDILRDHFQNSSEDPSSYPSKTPTSSSTDNLSPISRGIRELEDCSLVESTRASSSRGECGMSQEPTPSGQDDQLARMASESDFTSVRPTSRRPLEATRFGELKTHRKWKQQKLSTGAHGVYQWPHQSLCVPSSKENKPKARSSIIVADGGERANSRPKKRRSRISRGDSSAETQRMTHIAVERNRRKQMNDHLSALKALMPSTFVQKTDQASIIGGAVEFVKELEVILESLLSKQRRRYGGILGPGWNRFNIHPGPLLCTPYNTASDSAPSVLSTNATSEDPSTSGLSSRRTTMSSELLAVRPENTRVINEVRAECKSTAATVDVKVLGDNAIVHITTHRRAKQLVTVIVALESLDFNILHTSVTTCNSTVLYTFNAKVGPKCRMTVNQIAAALHQNFHCLYAIMHDHVLHLETMG